MDLAYASQSSTGQLAGYVLAGNCYVDSKLVQVWARVFLMETHSADLLQSLLKTKDRTEVSTDARWALFGRVVARVCVCVLNVCGMLLVGLLSAAHSEKEHMCLKR